MSTLLINKISIFVKIQRAIREFPLISAFENAKTIKMPAVFVANGKDLLGVFASLTGIVANSAF
jgi:hypothetical protein